MNIEECVDKGLLKKGKPSPEMSKKSLDVAAYKLDRATKLLLLQAFDEVVTNAYAAMFHSARALLFMDGYSEKSHYAVFCFLKENYGNKLEARFLNEFNSLRLQRHELSYGLEMPLISKCDSEAIVNVASDFLVAVRKLVAC